MTDEGMNECDLMRTILVIAAREELYCLCLGGPFVLIVFPNIQDTSLKLQNWAS